MNKELTKAEIQVMSILWDNGPSFINDIIALMDDPKPAYTTVSTIARILNVKGFVEYEAFGKNHRYFATVSREEYMTCFLTKIKRDFFHGSFSSLVSFFARNEKLSNKDIEDVVKILNENRNHPEN